jgi:hypothetical protein
MPQTLPIPRARTQAQKPIPLSPLHHRIQELETLADGLLGLLRLCEDRLRLMARDRDQWRRRAEALKGVRHG